MSGRRPPSILWFAGIQFTTLGLGLINSIVAWPRELAIAEAAHHGAGFLLFNMALTFGIVLLLVWLIAYRRSNFAKWVLVGMTCLGLPFMIPAWRMLAQMGALPLAINLIQTALTLLSIWLLFRADSRDWFRGTMGVDPEIFR